MAGSRTPSRPPRIELEDARLPSQGSTHPRVTKASVLSQRRLFGAGSAQGRPVAASSQGAIPRGAHPDGRKPPPLHHQVLVLRGTGHRGRVHRKGHRAAERVELRPADHAYDVVPTFMRVRRGDERCAGRQQAGAHGGSRSRASERANTHPRLARSQPARAVLSRKRQRLARDVERALLAASNAGHRSALGCTSRRR